MGDRPALDLRAAAKTVDGGAVTYTAAPGSVDADALVLLSDVDGVYDGDPRSGPASLALGPTAKEMP